MARRCDLCGKARQVGHKVSHSNIKTKKVWQPNLQRVRAVINGRSIRVTVCTRCLRDGKITKRSVA